jgi:hypothetical protein
MKMNELRKMRDRSPFRPFLLHLSSGDVLPVAHPELLSLSPDVNDLFTLWVGKEWNLVEVSNITRISVAKAVEARGD